LARMGVVMAVRDGAPFVGEAVESVLSQTFRDWEMVVVDDGSSDDTAQVLSVFRDPRIRVLRTEGVGRPAARNLALQALDTPWIAVLDGDDRMAPHRLERQGAFLSEHPEVDVLATAVILVDPEGRAAGRILPPPSHEEILRRLPKGNCLPHPSSVIRSEALRRAGGYRELFPYSQDYDLWLRLAEGGARFASLEEPLTFYRVHPGSASVGRREIQEAYASLARLCRRARLRGEREPRPSSREELFRLARREGAFHLALGRWHSRNGRWREGTGHALLALLLGGWRDVETWAFLALALLPPPLRRALRRASGKDVEPTFPSSSPPGGGPAEETHESEETHSEDLPRLPQSDPPAAVVR